MIAVRRHLLCLCLLALAAPAAHAQAPAGGTEYVEDVSYGPDGSRLEAGRAQLLGGALRIAGTLPAAGPGRQVVIQHQVRDGGWKPAATVTVRQDGMFEAFWTPTSIGRTLVRAVPADAAPEAQASAASPMRQLTVYRRAIATYFGPGLFGRRMACGRTLTRRTVGVAHRTLPCGTKVDLFYEGRTITVPVVDRGPFRKNTSWDLTSATAKRLGFTHTDAIGAVRVRSSG